MVFNETSGWVTNYINNGRVGTFRAIDDMQTKRYHVEMEPFDVVAAGDNIWVTNPLSNSVGKISRGVQ